MSGSEATEKKDHGAQRSHWLQSSFVIVGEVMGAGVLGLPACVGQMGWVLGITSILAFGVMAVYSGHLISETRNRWHPNCGTFADIAERLSRPSHVSLGGGGGAEGAGEAEGEDDSSSAELKGGETDEAEVGAAVEEEEEEEEGDGGDDEGAMLLTGSKGSRGAAAASECCEKTAEVCGCGRGMSLLVGTTRWMMIMNWFIALPFFLMAAANSLSVAFAVVPGAEDVCSTVWTLIVAICLLGVSQVRDLHALSWVALASSVALLIAVAIMLTALATQPFPNHAYQPTEAGPIKKPFRVMSAFGGIVWAWGGQAMYPEIMREMRDARTFFPHAVVTSSTVMGLVYLFTAVMGYQLAGATVSSFLPHSLQNGWAKSIVGALLFFHTFVSYILSSQPLTLNVHQMWFPSTFARFDEEGFCSRVQLHWAIISVLMIAFAYIISNAVPFFGDLQNIAGALTAAPVLLLWPPMFYLMSARRAGDKVGIANWIFCGLFICVIAPAVTVLATVASVANLFADWGDFGLPFACHISSLEAR